MMGKGQNILVSLHLFSARLRFADDGTNDWVFKNVLGCSNAPKQKTILAFLARTELFTLLAVKA